MKNKQIFIPFFMIGLIFFLSGCTNTNLNNVPNEENQNNIIQNNNINTENKDNTENKETNNKVQIANPAATFCIEQGGKIEVRDSKEGEVGYCIFSDGSECEEWSYLRKECAPGNKVEDMIIQNDEEIIINDKNIEIEAIRVPKPLETMPDEAIIERDIKTMEAPKIQTATVGSTGTSVSEVCDIDEPGVMCGE